MLAESLGLGPGQLNTTWACTYTQETQEKYNLLSVLSCAGHPSRPRGDNKVETQEM